MLSLQRIGRGAPLLVLLGLLLACSRPPVTPEERQNLARTAAYAGQVKDISRRFDALITRTVGYQDLARALRDRAMAPVTAVAQGRRLSAELRPEFDRLSAALARRVRIPDELVTEDHRDRMETLIAIAQGYRDWARSFIEAGEDLLADAIGGNLAGIINTDIKRGRYARWQLDQQLVLIDEELAAQDDRFPSYHLMAARKSQLEALRAMIEGGYAAHGTGPRREVAENKALAARWIRRGFERVEDGRENLPETLRRFRSPKVAERIGAARQQIMIGLLVDNYPKAFDVEERILRELERSIDRVFEPGETPRVFDTAALDAVIVRVNALSEERDRLHGERERRVVTP
ncbi:MAG: hypothetical protein QNJ30_27140 [Kiloniellales bacterium]|nr:hypothetical protein [Kiloniellales bacterium]